MNPAANLTGRRDAADAEGTRPGRALILDQFVAVSLKDIDGWGISRTGPWEPATYERRLHHAHGIAVLRVCVPMPWK
ncbi:MAG: hypothetical protein ACRDUX_20220 [Mycobacterium sp.]